MRPEYEQKQNCWCTKNKSWLFERAIIIVCLYLLANIDAILSISLDATFDSFYYDSNALFFVWGYGFVIKTLRWRPIFKWLNACIEQVYFCVYVYIW